MFSLACGVTRFVTRFVSRFVSRPDLSSVAGGVDLRSKSLVVSIH